MRMLAACSLGGAGHLQPLRPFLDAARADGSETLVVGPPAIAAMVGEIGHPFAPGGEPDEAEVAPIRERLSTAPRYEASVLGNRELFGRLATTAMLPAMADIVASWRPDLVLREPCEFASAVVVARSGTACAQVAIGLAEVEWASIGIAAPALEAHRSGLTDAVRRTPYLSRFPGSLDPSRFPITLRFREEPVAPTPLPDWWAGSTAPLVYVSFGTVLGHMTRAEAAYRTVLEAVDDLDARVLLTVGRRFDATRLGEVPANVHVEPWIEQRDVLAEAELVVCHGGSGTTYGALAAGVPVVVWPMFADQFRNGRTVAAAGVGVTLEGEAGGGGTVPADIAAAIESVRADSSFRRRAARIAAEMSEADDVRAILLSVAGRSRYYS